MTGLGLRFALELGIHRRKPEGYKLTLEDELKKRVSVVKHHVLAVLNWVRPFGTPIFPRALSSLIIYPPGLFSPWIVSNVFSSAHHLSDRGGDEVLELALQ